MTRLWIAMRQFVAFNCLGGYYRIGRKSLERRREVVFAYMLTRNDAHANNISLKFTHCSPAFEVLTVSARSYYLPHEFTHVLVVCVYSPLSVNSKEAADQIATHVHNLDTTAPDAVKVVAGDFNHCDLTKVLLAHQQQVTCRTRGDCTAT